MFLVYSFFFQIVVCDKVFLTNPGDNTQQSSSCMANYHPSQKLSKLDEPDKQDTTGEVEMSSWMMYSCGPLHMDKQRQDVQFEPTYSSSVLIRNVALRISRKQWTIGMGGKRRSGISVLIVRHDDDDDLQIALSIFFHAVRVIEIVIKMKKKKYVYTCIYFHQFCNIF